MADSGWLGANVRAAAPSGQLASRQLGQRPLLVSAIGRLARSKEVDYGVFSPAGLLMRIAKPLLLITTPIGVAFGLYEAWRLAGGLVILMAALLGLVSVAMLSIVRTIRREREEERKKLEEAGTSER